MTTKSPLNITIFGVGAMGTLFGSRLAPLANVTLFGTWLEQIDTLNVRLTAREAQLKAQFTAMETAIAQLKSSGDSLSSALSSLSASK